MKFDSRNPFAAWGFEQEVYTKTSGNDPEKTGMNTMTKDKDGNYIEQEYNPIMPTDSEFYVNKGDIPQMTEQNIKDWSDAQGKDVHLLLSNEERMIPSTYIAKRAFYKNDMYERQHDALYNNTELNYYGIQYADLYTVGDSQGEIVPVVAE